ncbi:MAG TPA: hypothetical protein VMT69_00450, partial [Kineosporiaceae bacterium]|nr:hypothetical protein [Kineosporiaceae bacterium]
MPLVLPVEPVACNGSPTGGIWTEGAALAVPAGRLCARADAWLRPGPDGGEGHRRGPHGLVDWILHPDSASVTIPGWAPLLPGRARPRLADVNNALNTWSGTVVWLPVQDGTRHGRGGPEAHLVAMIGFRLDHAYLDRPNAACAASVPTTCIVGTVVSLPQPSPSPTCSPQGQPTPPVSATPTVT